MRIREGGYIPQYFPNLIPKMSSNIVQKMYFYYSKNARQHEPKNRADNFGHKILIFVPKYCFLVPKNKTNIQSIRLFHTQPLTHLFFYTHTDLLSKEIFKNIAIAQKHSPEVGVCFLCGGVIENRHAHNLLTKLG